MANDAQEQAIATAEIIEERFTKGESISDILDGNDEVDGMSLGDVRFENNLAPGKQPLPLEHRSGKTMVTCGGPTTWVQSNGEVVSYWGTEEGHAYLSMDVAKALDDYFADLFDNAVEQMVKARTNKTW